MIATVRQRRRAVCMSLAAASLVRGSALAPPAQADLPGGMSPVAAHGFGDSANSYAWSMAWFKGALYVGTARNAMCVEKATLAYYLPYGTYTRHPAPGVTCPPSIHEADLRAEIWRYTPHSGRWRRVYRSPRLPDPRATGRRIARDIGYRGMVVLGHKLYVGAVTADEFVPELRRDHPPRILRSTDGRHFRSLRTGRMLIRTHTGPQRPIGFRAMTAVRGRLYVTASGGLTGDGVVLRVDRPAGASPRLVQVSPPRLAVFELSSFAGRLYAGTGDPDAGYGVWRSDGSRVRRWTPVLTGGAGRGKTITSVVSMQPYRGWLYVGASGWGTSVYPASELVRVSPDGQWDVVVGNPRGDKTPLSGLPDGFGNAFNAHFWRMQTYRGALLLGTNDWSWSLAGTPGLGEQFAPELGFDLYGSCDGTGWWVGTRNAFGRGAPDFGVRTMAATPAGLFLGTTDVVNGATVLQSRAQPCADGTRRLITKGPA